MRAFVLTGLISLLFLGQNVRADVCDSAANLIQNCGFETGDLTFWAGSPANQSGNWFGVDTYDAYTGSYGAYIGGTGSFAAGNTNFGILQQSVTTSVGTQYTLSYYLAHDTSSDPTATPDDVFFTNINGVLVPGSKELNTGQVAFTQFSYSFVANSTTTTLQFEAEDANFFFSLDDVSINAATVPELASAFLIGPALGCLLLLGGRLRR